MASADQPAAHIGVLAHSVPGAAQCFRAITDYGAPELGEHRHPDVTMDCIAMGHSMAAWDAGDHDAIRAVLAVSIARLGSAGADFFVCPDNTAHLALERPGPELALPGLHIAEVVAQQAASAGYRTVGLLGTRWTMDGPIYPRVLGAHGIGTRSPSDADRGWIQQVTFAELVNGVFTSSVRESFVEIIGKLADDGCDAVALVCTEFPLLVPPGVSPLPTLDSTDLLAAAAVQVAIGAHERPTWRGGPPSR
jgi:aspartate racemase